MDLNYISFVMERKKVYGHRFKEDEINNKSEDIIGDEWNIF